MDYLLRSMLFVPAYNEKFMSKAVNAKSDAVIFDLEDSVPFFKEEKARSMIREYVSKGLFVNRQVFIRVHELGTESLFKDLELLNLQGITGLLLPKIEKFQDICVFDALVAERELKYGLVKGKIKFAPLIETAAAVLHLEDIARSSDRLIALIFGGEDYLDSVYGIHTENPKAFDNPRSKIIQVARTYDLLPIDTHYLDIKNEEGFYKEKRESANMGFAGTLLISPRQICWANDCFSPSLSEIEYANRILTAMQETLENGGNITVVDGKMVGPPMRKRAEKIMALAKLIESFQ